MNTLSIVEMLNIPTLQTDIKPTNILLQLEDSNKAISRYLSEVPPRIDPQRDAVVPLREVITTPLVSEMRQPHIRVIDFGVGR